MRTLIIAFTITATIGAAACFTRPPFNGGDGDAGIDAGGDAGSDAGACAVAPPAGFTQLTFRKIVAGRNHACGIDATGAGQAGRLWCWGKNDSGQLGVGLPLTTGEPLQVGDAADWIDVAAGIYHSCAVNAAGRVSCWGSNTNRQVDPAKGPSWSAVVQVAGVPAGAVRVFAGGHASCALAADGSARCWGAFEYAPAPSPVVPLVAGGQAAWAEIALGDSHACATTPSKQVYCWGRSFSGELGVDVASGADVPIADAVTRDATAYDDLSVEGPVTCGVTTTGALHCWGRVTNGHLGPGVTENSTAPVVVVDAGVAEVALASEHVCYRTTDGAAHCYGIDEGGALGGGVFDDSATIVDVALAGVASITVGEHFSCAVDTCGRGWCWGSNAYGELGAGLSSPRLDRPGRAELPLGATDRVRKVVTGDSHSCALVVTGGALAGRIYCWGDGRDFQVRDGDSALFATPAPITDDPADVFEDVVAGRAHTCARRSDGSLRCWGDNTYGQLGVAGAGHVSDIVSPAAPFVAVAAGSFSSCAIDAVGQLYCWGSVVDNASTPTPMTTPTGLSWTSVAIGSTTGDPFVIGVLRGSDGAHIYGFGDDCAIGLGGGGGTTLSTSPVEILASVTGSADVVNVIAADSGGGHACAHVDPGGVTQLWCWGANAYLQASTVVGACAAPTERVPPAGLSFPAPVEGATPIDVGAQHTVAVMTSLRPLGWGDNNNGALGQAGGGTSNVPTPTPLSVAGFTTPFREIATSAAHSCALTEDRTAVYCWGRNREGEVGDGSRDYNLPTPAGLITP